MSNEEQHRGCLVYMGDEKLPSYVGIIINHYEIIRIPIKQANINVWIRGPPA